MLLSMPHNSAFAYPITRMMSVYSDFHDNYRCRLDVSRIVDKDAAQMRQGGVMARCEAKMLAIFVLFL